ncbi:MAG: AMP-binding protein [bacterium]|nr:AMP-binding protein [bacterium]
MGKKINFDKDRLSLAAGGRSRERGYWTTKLSGELNRAEFPFDRREKTSERRMETIKFTFPDEIVSQLDRLSNRSHQTLLVILTAGTVTLLNRYGGHGDIIIGTPILKQETQPDDQLINTALALRNNFEDQPAITFKQLLIQAGQTMVEANNHQAYPLEILVEELGLSPYSPGSDFSLFDVAVVLENIQDPAYLDHLDINIRFLFNRTRDRLEGRLEYNASHYEDATIRRIVSHYINLMQSVTANVDLPIAEAEFLSPGEMNQLLTGFNDTAKDFPPDTLIHRWFEDQAAKTPEAVALMEHHYEENSETRSITISYRDLNQRANQLAYLLREKGVSPDSPVGVLLDRSIDMVVGILAVLKAGGAYLPIDPDYPGDRIAAILDNSGAKLLLSRHDVSRDIAFAYLENIQNDLVAPVRTQPRPPIPDFNLLLKPDRSLVDYKKYNDYIGISPMKHTVSFQSTRGCPYKCDFCHKIWPKVLYTRTAENMYEEFSYLYDAGVRRFVFVDDIFNMDRKNSSRFLEMIIKNKLDIQLFFSNGLRGDILTEEFIDMMVEAGMVNAAVALESGSPRIQKLMRKFLRIEKFKHNIDYLCKKHPLMVLELEMMIGFPTETEEEALMNLEFIKEMKWIDFPNLHILKIYPNSDMFELAVKHGVPVEEIYRSTNFAYHQLPDTLPFPKSFAREYQSRLMTEYVLNPERLSVVLPRQAKLMTEEEMVLKYNSYLPHDIRKFSDIYRLAGLPDEQFADVELITRDPLTSPVFTSVDPAQNSTFVPPIKTSVPVGSPPFRILLLDLSQFFSKDAANMLYDMVDPPLGLMYLLTHLNATYGPRLEGKIAKARVDFKDYGELKELLTQFKPHLIATRTLSYYKHFYHKTVSMIKKWGFDAPIITGGPYSTSDYMLVLQDVHVELAALGEGEYTIIEIVQAMIDNDYKLPPPETLEKIQGISFVKNKDKPLLRETRREVMFLDDLEETLAHYPVENPQNVAKPHNLLYFISTSGSTGVPKCVMLEHRNLANLLHHQFKETQVDHTRPLLQFASIGFDVASQELFSGLLSGSTVHLIDTDLKSDVIRLFQLVRENQIEILYLPPAFLKFIFSDADFTRQFPRDVRHIITAGEQLVIPPALETYIEEHPVTLHNHYGPSETHVVATLAIAAGSPWNRHLPPIGKPISNTALYILDSHRLPVPVGVAGHLHIAGANVGRGYLDADQLSAGKFFENPFQTRFNFSHDHSRIYNTGDLARRLPDGNIEFIGRSDHQVKIRGHRIELQEVESHLAALPNIAEALVIDMKDSTGETCLCAYIVPASADTAPSGEVEVELSELRNLLLDSVPDYMVPAYFVTLQRIPLTPNGKVDRRALPEPVTHVSRAYIAPRDNIDRKLIDIWSGVLSVEKGNIGIETDFFDLGGHSLKATILISRIHKLFNVKITLGEMFENPTVSGLARHIKTEARHQFIPIQPVETRTAYPLSLSQRRMYIFQQMQLQGTSCNLSSVWTLEGRCHPEKLRRTLQQLIHRHESLRTSFEMEGEEPVQRTHSNVEFQIEYFDLAANEHKEKNEESIIENFIRPFDLEKPPLLRVGLIKQDETRHIAVFDMHHIVSDGVSMGIFVREFMDIYSGKKLPPLRIHYKDFSRWQQDSVGNSRFNSQENYWLKQFAGQIPALNLPTDYPRPEEREFKGRKYYYQINPQLTAQIKQLAINTGSTLFMVLLTAYNLLLSQYTGGEDIVVGTGVAGRRHVDLDNMIGLFINMLALRNRPFKEKSVVEFLAEVKKNTLEAFANQDYPYETLINRLGLQGDSTGNPLFEAILQMQNMEIPDVDIPGLSLKPYPYETHTSRFDLVFYCIENERENEAENTIQLMVLYSTQLFLPATIEKMVERFTETLSQMAADQTLKLKDIALSQTLVKVETDILREEQGDFEF